MRSFVRVLAPLAVLAACSAPTPDADMAPEPVVVTTDIDNFWEAFDLITATDDSAQKRLLLDSLYIRRGSPGLEAIMERRGYTTDSYLDAIADYPRFWASVRPNTHRAPEYSREIEGALGELRRLYPDVRPARIYFTVGALMTPGMTLEDVVFIGSESAMADSSVVTDELPGRLGTNLRAYFDSNPIEHLAFLNVHEYVHTQQGPFGGTLAAVAVQEGVAEFVATLAAGQDSPTPAVAFGEANEARVRDRFATEMFSPNYDDWLYNNFENDFGVRDLGYYVGYAIAKRYHEAADDPAAALRELIELDYQNPSAVAAVIEASGYFERSIAELEEAYALSQPVVERMTPFDNGALDVPPGLTTLTIDFSAPMNPRFRGFEFGPLGEENVLRIERFVGWSDDGRTLTLEVALLPEHRHQVQLTPQFRTMEGAALDPYLIDVTTTR
ncbi:MAG: hypothetical protein AAF389_10325 [Gemmatimonadota bacterium]